MSSRIEQLADFTTTITAEDLPDSVANETRRVILDSLGCALASDETDPGRIGIAYGRMLGGDSAEATIIGQHARTSLHGAAFANTELIAALDLAPINAPAHVAPYVVASALAAGEVGHAPGERMLTAVAAGLEITARIAESMDRNRAVKDGQVHFSTVMGFATSVFGSAAAVAIMRGLDLRATTDAIGIAAATSPVNALRAWQMHTPNTSVKYSLGGGLTLAALTASFLAEFGHRGDPQLLDDTSFGYPRYIGTDRWEPGSLTAGLGREWIFPASTHFKPYPHCRVTHAPFDAVCELVTQNDIAADDIESLVVYGEAWATGIPTYMNNVIERPYDAQFSFAHGLSVAAHRVPPGRDWQRPEIVYDASVRALMDRIEWRAHEAWASAYASDPTARPTRVEITANGERYVSERAFPKGTRSEDPATYMSDEEVFAKFRHNAQGAVSEDQIESAIGLTCDLTALADVSDLATVLRPEA